MSIRLCGNAGEIGLLGVPIFMFQEGSDGVTRHAFQEIAKLTGGAYFRLDASSARQLRELSGGSRRLCGRRTDAHWPIIRAKRAAALAFSSNSCDDKALICWISSSRWP